MLLAVAISIKAPGVSYLFVWSSLFVALALVVPRFEMPATGSPPSRPLAAAWAHLWRIGHHARRRRRWCDHAWVLTALIVACLYR
jgi:hypothetical protein